MKRSALNAIKNRSARTVSLSADAASLFAFGVRFFAYSAFYFYFYFEKQCMKRLNASAM